ncbi:GntR family transcriptional regulator [uncultured Maribacter sp.]|uniref:GntR family transcriptional regulator n=1 Tax=uncultured Maribacter sp. TaxID=431308 RepID=UPI00262884E1|nr:GntR family transcriptional regulator [uncultured Maribacter sp.]
MEEFELEKNPEKPKYLLLSDGITKQINEKRLVLGQKLPSVNKLSEEFNFSRETVFKALAHLSEKGIVKAVDKIGYFVSDVSPETDFRVFLMLDKYTSFKEEFNNSFVNKLGERAKVSLYFHYQNIELFESLILQNFKNFTHFVISTSIRPNEILYEALDKIPPERLIIIDKYVDNLVKGYGMIYQDFENDIFNVLSININTVKKYKKIILLLQKNDSEVVFTEQGFARFCKEYNFKGEVHSSFSALSFAEGNLYITTDSNDYSLVNIIKSVREKKWELGKHVGVISYNETPLKEILEEGITTISSNYKKMGEQAANMILEAKFEHKMNNSKVVLRKSF